MALADIYRDSQASDEQNNPANIQHTHKQQVQLPTLLDLPIDILNQIISHTSHTNDLCALALTHSVLHALVIPCIYSRFDIVWPEALPTTESRVGVDALTYGLSSLVMSHEAFGEAQHQHCSACKCCPTQREPQKVLQSSHLPLNIRRGNNFAQYTKRFSLGNGPPDWTQEYSISREGGKMLGTLVALAVGRMRTLESFVWDMPTGVLRDVWLALGSLATRFDSANRLEKVWVRWHDNRDVAPLPRHDRQHTVPSLLHGSVSSLFHIPHYPTVEFPTFSALPPLKSITSLDIDELSYAEELSILLARSLDCVRELRLGVAAYAQRDLIFRPVDDRTVVPPEFRTCPPKTNPGGILGVLMHEFCQPFTVSTTTEALTMDNNHLQARSTSFHDFDPSINTRSKDLSTTDVDELDKLLAAQTLDDDQNESAGQERNLRQSAPPVLERAEQYKASTRMIRETLAEKAQKPKLKLSIFELERVYLSIPILSRAIDWTRLESLTLLGCVNSEELWIALRRQFSPSSRSSISAKSSARVGLRASSLSSLMEAPVFKLKIRRLHTDTVSKPLLDFLKHSLAPNTLDSLYLQRTAAHHTSPEVSIDDIARCVRRHRGSLRKLLIDSEYKNMPRFERERPDAPPDTSSHEWMLNDDLITMITSPKMRLRELSISIDHRKLLQFLQRLPNASTIRSLHTAHIANHPNGPRYDRGTVADSVLNIIAVRPEIEICYLAIDTKCYEVVEYDPKNERESSQTRPIAHGLHAESQQYAPHILHPPTVHPTVEAVSDDDDDGGAAHHLHYMMAPDFSDDDVDDDAYSHTSSRSRSRAGDTDDEVDNSELGYKLREILFYDDKISIFKARHGRL